MAKFQLPLAPRLHGLRGLGATHSVRAPVIDPLTEVELPSVVPSQANRQVADFFGFPYQGGCLLECSVWNVPMD